MAFFKTVGEGKVRRSGLWGLVWKLMSSPLAKRFKEAEKIAKGNFDGDGTNLGGVLVVAKGGTKVQYAYREAEVGDVAPVEEVVAQAKKVAA
mmetsp:Transcript_21173/g.67025  ORF Transcript_21173/g.67025 Transcript_21173/m.67025 type:complete len:92 (+) Transcript_21173:121-396(+)